MNEVAHFSKNPDIQSILVQLTIQKNYDPKTYFEYEWVIEAKYKNGERVTELRENFPNAQQILDSGFYFARSKKGSYGQSSISNRIFIYRMVERARRPIHKPAIAETYPAIDF